MHSVGEFSDVGGSSGTNTLINSTTDNPAAGNGIILRTLQFIIEIGGKTTELQIGGFPVMFVSSIEDSLGGQEWGINTAMQLPLPIFVEPGETVTAVQSHTTNETAITWDRIQ